MKAELIVMDVYWFFSFFLGQNVLVLFKFSLFMVEKAKADILEWMESTQDVPQVLSRQQVNMNRPSVWSLPPVGWVQCNYDASHFSGTREIVLQI